MLKIFAAGAVTRVPEGRNTQHPTPGEPGFRNPGTRVFSLPTLGRLAKWQAWADELPDSSISLIQNEYAYVLHETQ